MFYYIDNFVLEWFYENKLNITLFNRLPLEILTKIWKLKRKYELDPIKIKLSIHMNFKQRAGHGGSNIFGFRYSFFYYQYLNENNIHIDQELNITRNDKLLKGIVFSKKSKPPNLKLTQGYSVPITPIEEEEEDGCLLSRAMSTKTKIFSYYVVEDNFDIDIQFENYTKER